jgi:hypothetical protein
MKNIILFAFIFTITNLFSQKILGGWYYLQKNDFRIDNTLGSIRGGFPEKLHYSDTSILGKSYYVVYCIEDSNDYKFYVVNRFKDFFQLKSEIKGISNNGYKIYFVTKKSKYIAFGSIQYKILKLN